MNDKVLFDVLSGAKDANIKFKDLQNLLESLGFNCRVKGDHFIYKNKDIPERINIQPIGNKAKSYQVKQVRQIILKYHLGGE